METAAGLIKLKPETKVTVEDWKATLRERADETIATLKDEGVTIESWFEVEISGESYLLWYMRAESISKVWEIAMKSKHDIDAYHFKVMADITAPDGEIQAIPILDLCNENPST
jgi:hypothetical protein